MLRSLPLPVWPREERGGPPDSEVLQARAAVLARALGEHRPQLTIGNDPGTAEALEAKLAAFEVRITGLDAWFLLRLRYRLTHWQ